MNYKRIEHFKYLLVAIVCLSITGTSCNTTRHIPEGSYLLRSNTVKLKSSEVITQKGEMKENLSALIIQKPNTYSLGVFPYKLWLYNSRYEKYSKDNTNFQVQSKTVEPPVIYDSSSKRKSILNMKAYLFHRGYFYSQITDTVVFSKKKAFVTFNVNTGTNYLIKDLLWEIHDSVVNSVVLGNISNTVLKQGVEFSYTLLEEERSRITALLRDIGYYKFSNDNINFVLDTLNKQYLKDIENPFESAINFIALQKKQKKPTLNITTIIKSDNDPTVFTRYGINRLRVFTDYEGSKDFRDSSMGEKRVSGIIFRFHKYYVNPEVVKKHIFLKPETYYSQKDYDQTISRLNDLGIFQSVRITFREDTSRGPGWLNSNIFLSPGNKMDFNSNIEASNGTTYTLGTALTLGYRNRNFARGANLLSINTTGSLESQHQNEIDAPFFKQFALLTKSVGANASIEFPKFLIPIAQNQISPRNAPRTIIGVGWNLLDRVQYFTLINTSANFTYRWRETETKSWEASPAFVNNINLYNISPEFQARLDENQYLKNSYRNTFIEGENLTFTFTDREKKGWKNYNYIKLSGEEAGGLIGGVNSVLKVNKDFARYVKFDFDVQRFFNYMHSTIALRFNGGIGLPYGNSVTLPYVKQYFVGGSFSIRGWRIRSLGPGSFISPDSNKINLIDRTGDIKMEMTGEYRFDIVKLFSGAIKMNGALFTDAGNIWLTKPSPNYPGGEFHLNKFGSDIAISSGAGLRFDAGGFFVLRVDVAMPVRKPDYIQGDGWVLHEIDFGNSDWRKDNLILNIAIGYPF